MLETLKSVLTETLKDSIGILPILFIAYLFMEMLERKTGEKTKNAIRKAGRMGPVYGSLLGALPQCGFSAAASSLYSGRVITLGTLIAVYLSTSDEMLPILISEKVDPLLIAKILGLKVLIGLVAGLLIDFLIRHTRGKKHLPQEPVIDTERVCEHDHCHSDHDSVWVSALKHTGKIMLFIIIVTLVLNGILAYVGPDVLSGLIINKPVIAELITGLIGLIPNCVSSVVITQLYIEGVIGFGPMMSGLLVGAGIGLLVLFRSNGDMKKNVSITGILYTIGVVSGVIIDLTGFTV